MTKIKYNKYIKEGDLGILTMFSNLAKCFCEMQQRNNKIKANPNKCDV